jgi:hypothetical protein
MKIFLHGALMVVGSLLCTSLSKKKLIWGGLILGLIFLGFLSFKNNGPLLKHFCYW